MPEHTTGAEHPEAAATPADPDGPRVGPAWLLRDVTHVPGVLSLAEGRLRFVSTRRVVFDATPDELDLAVHRARRGRFHVTVDGERVGLAVVRPPGAVPVPSELLSRLVPADAGARTGVEWQRLLRPGTGGAGPSRRSAREPRPEPRAGRALGGLVPRLLVLAARPGREEHATA